MSLPNCLLVSQSSLTSSFTLNHHCHFIKSSSYPNWEEISRLITSHFNSLKKSFPPSILISTDSAYLNHIIFLKSYSKLPPTCSESLNAISAFNSHIGNYEILEPYLHSLLIKSNILLCSIKYHLKQHYNKSGISKRTSVYRCERPPTALALNTG